jgi:PleD family two-component response regulator
MLDRPSRSEIDLAGSIIAARLRKEDGFELRDDSEFTVVLAKTDPQAARVVAARLASEISFRSVAFRKRNWVAEFVD